MKEITEAIAKVKAIKADDETTMKSLVEVEVLLNQADKNDQELVEKHGKLLGDYRELLTSHPSTQSQEQDDNPPPTPPKSVTWDEALASVLAKRKEN